MSNSFISILSKNGPTYSKNLHKFLIKNNYDSSLVLDNISKQQKLIDINYYGLTKIFPKTPTAWEFSIFNIAINKLYNKYSYFFFLEDDVYSRKYETFIDLIKTWNKYDYDLIAKKIKSKEEEPNWMWWEDKNNWDTFSKPYKSFNTISRISSKLIQRIIDYQKKYQKFSFHEILFMSLCVENNYSFIDYEKQDDLKQFIDINTIIPALSDTQIKYDNKLYHPYKKILGQ